MLLAAAFINLVTKIMFKWLNTVVHTTASIKKIKFKSRLKIQSHLKTLHHTEWLPSCCKQKILLAMWMWHMDMFMIDIISVRVMMMI